MPGCFLSQMANSFVYISNGLCLPGLNGAWTEVWSISPVARCCCAFWVSEAHWLASLNSCTMCCHIITHWVGVMALNHIQMFTSVKLRVLSSSWWIAAGTPSRLCFHWASTAVMLVGVPSQVLRHGQLQDHATWHDGGSCPACMLVLAGINWTMLTIWMKKGSNVGHTLNHSTFLGAEWPRAQGRCPVCVAGGSWMKSHSLHPGDFQML